MRIGFKLGLRQSFVTRKINFHSDQPALSKLGKLGLIENLAF